LNLYKSKRERYEVLRSQLYNERSTFIPHWKELSEYVSPRRSRFEISDVNKGDKRNHKIYDSTATKALRTLASGMMSGITSPARPWFRLTTSDPALAELGPVKGWLYLVTQRMSAFFLKSNLYRALPLVYADIGLYGTAGFGVEEDDKELLNAQVFPIGSYMIAKNTKGQVDVFIRDFRLTVRQLVEKFGVLNPKTGSPDWSNFSPTVKHSWDNSNYESWVDVCQVIEPNHFYDPRYMNSKYKKFSSCYYERGKDMAGDVYLRESGYDYFPVLAPRWEVTGEDVYGTNCPGMTALPDIKMLQTMQKRKAQAVEKMVNPPMTATNDMRNTVNSVLPGDITYMQTGNSVFKPAYQVEPRINELVLDIQDTRQSIQKDFYEDLFLMLATLDRRQITAREIDERHEEKLLALGPVLEQLNQDLLDPLIDIAFDTMVRTQRVPDPPPELQNQDLKVEYISIMAQSQKLIGIAGIDHFTNFVSHVAAAVPTVLDKIDTDQLIDIYGDMTSVPPGIIRPDKDVETLRQSRAKQMQQQQAAENMRQGAVAVKDLAGANTESKNALTDLMQKAQRNQNANALGIQNSGLG